MKAKAKIELDFEADKLNNSTENVISGDSFSTEVSVVAVSDLKELEVDSIGGNEKMTSEEAVLISQFIKIRKSLNSI